MVSMASFDSLPEERSPSSPGVLIKNGITKSRGRPYIFEDKARSCFRQNEIYLIDEAREAKRLKIVHEFYNTERVYVEGLDLVYSVRFHLLGLIPSPNLSCFSVAFPYTNNFIP